MNNIEARQILGAELESFERRSHAELAHEVNENLSYEIKGASGAHYQIEILVLWDSEPDGAIRVIGFIDDGSWQAFLPLTDSILKYPSE